MHKHVKANVYRRSYFQLQKQQQESGLVEIPVYLKHVKQSRSHVLIVLILFQRM